MNDMLKDELYHKWTDATKANYNREYYQKHKDWWKTKYADFTGGVRQVAANAKTAAKNELRRTEDRAWDARQALKGETPQSLWKSGANDIRKKLEPHAKAAKNLWDDGAKDIKTKAYKTARKTAKKVHDAKVDVEWAISNNDAVGNVRRKAKDFVSNWKSGAQGVKSAAKSATSKAGKSFLENWKSGAQSIRDSKIPGIENVSRKRGKGNTIEKQTSSVTVGDVMEGMKGSKRTLSGQPKGFVENWKQGAGDIKNAITKKKRKK